MSGPELSIEYQFHPVRKWRADFAHLESMTLIEIEGGIWANGRHSRGSGFVKDCEKYLEAALLGFKVIRLTEHQLNAETLDRIARHCERYTKSDDELLEMLQC